MKEKNQLIFQELKYKLILRDFFRKKINAMPPKTFFKFWFYFNIKFVYFLLF